MADLQAALSTLPAAAYLLIEQGILRGNAPIQGARYDVGWPLGEKEYANWFHSVWVFVLLGVEAMKAYRANPYFR